jgi:thiol-disulfide isomerase/thioredoxin
VEEVEEVEKFKTETVDELKALIEPQSDDSLPAPLPEPRLSRRAAWMAMGSVALALGLLWAASDMSSPPASPEEELSAIMALDAAEDAKAIGKMAPLNYTVKDMNGADVRFSAYKGKIIVLNFWATWCEPCKEEIPDLVTLQQKYKDDLVVLGLSVESGDTPDKLKQYATAFKMNYPVLVGGGHDEIQEAYGATWGVPITVIINRDGRIAKKQSGIRTLEQFEREIKPLL